jgi:hypothetical protein
MPAVLRRARVASSVGVIPAGGTGRLRVAGRRVALAGSGSPAALAESAVPRGGPLAVLRTDPRRRRAVCRGSLTAVLELDMDEARELAIDCLPDERLELGAARWHELQDRSSIAPALSCTSLRRYCFSQAMHSLTASRRLLFDIAVIPSVPDLRLGPSGPSRRFPARALLVDLHATADVPVLTPLWRARRGGYCGKPQTSTWLLL